MKSRSCFVIAWLTAACSTLPPIGKELSVEPGVSIQRVADTGQFGSHSQFGTRRGASHCEMTIDSSPFRLIAVHLWPGLDLDPSSRVPDGCYTIRATGESQESVRATIVRALGPALGVDVWLDPRSRVTRELRCATGKPASPFQPRAEESPRLHDYGSSLSGDGTLTEFSWYGNMNDLANFASRIMVQPVTDKSGVSGSFSWSGTYDSPRSFARQLAQAGIELVPLAELYYVVMAVPRREPQ